MMGAAALPPPKQPKPQGAEYCSQIELGEPQWINCDIRNFRMDILGQFGVIMADPPWDIHMELPYGTMADDEMRNLNVPALQTDGLIFLWVTGRAMELGREWYVLLLLICQYNPYKQYGVLKFHWFKIIHCCLWLFFSLSSAVTMLAV